ncbi:hypothetical protein KAT63_04865 [Candidatus Parcubacteria bacterium]|nr:hypothetical protein [Candidatus Parcubacteria bacterium]
MSEKFKSFVNNLLKFFQGNKKFNKKSFLSASIVVLFIAVSVSIPVHQAHAEIFNIGTKFLMDGIAYFIENGVDVVLNLIYVILFLILNLFLNLSAILVYFGAWLIDAVMEPVLYVGDAANPGVLTSSTVDIGWKTVRDMCNTFYLFFLLIIAFGTILRSSTFNAKNLLPKLVISLFLINFSAEITKLVIDFGQVFMYEIRNWMGTFKEGAGSLTSIVDQFNNEINAKEILKPSFEMVVKVAFALVYSLVLGFIYIMLAMFLLIRLIAFVLLIILSPIAFLSIAMPSMAKYTSRWWSELVKYSIFGPIFMFFLYLSATMANELVTNYTPVIAPESGFGVIESLVLIIFPHLIALIMLCAVIPVTQELGMAGSNKLIGGAAGIGKIAMGTYAGVKLAGGLGRRAGGEVTKRSDHLSRGVEGTKKWGYNKLGKMPGMQGAALKGKAGIEKRREDRLKKMEMDFGDLKSIDLKLLESKANSTLGTSDDKALLLKAAAAQGKLGDTEKDKDGKTVMKYGEYMTGAETSMSKKELGEITDKNLSMALQTNEGKERIAEIGKNPSKAGLSSEAQERLTKKESTKEEEYLREKMDDVVKDGKAYEVQDLDNEMSAKVWHESQDNDQRKSSFNRMNKEDRGKLSDGYLKNVKTFNKDGDIVNGKNEVVKKKGADGFEDEKKKINEEKNIKFSTDSVKLGKDLEAAFEWGGKDAAKNISKAFREFSPKEVAKLSNKDLEKYGHNANTSQVHNLDRAGEYEAIRSIKNSKKRKIGKLDKGETPRNTLEETKYKKYETDKKDINETKKNIEKELKKESKKEGKDKDQSKIDHLENDLEKIEDVLKDFESTYSDIIEGENDLKYIRDSLTGKKNK